MIAGCSPEREHSTRPIRVERTFDVDGCHVVEYNPPSVRNFYIAKCGPTTTVTNTISTGKHSSAQVASITHQSPEVLEEAKKIVEERRNKVLQKLSSEDKKVLGIE